MDSALQSSQLPPIEKLLAGLLNEIALRPDPLILVLDDYHLLREAAIVDAMVFLLDHLPPQLHLVLTTREDPDLPLARWRARDQLTEIRARDLLRVDHSVEPVASSHRRGGGSLKLCFRQEIIRLLHQHLRPQRGRKKPVPVDGGAAGNDPVIIIRIPLRFHQSLPAASRRT